MSTFAQQTTRSRHTSSSSITTPTTDGLTSTTNRSFGTQPRTTQSRERVISSTKINTSADSATIDGSSSSPRQRKFFFYFIY